MTTPTPKNIEDLEAQVAALSEMVAEAKRLLTGPIDHDRNGVGGMECGGPGGCFICDFVALSKTHHAIEVARCKNNVVEAASTPCRCSNHAIGKIRNHRQGCHVGFALAALAEAEKGRP